MTSRIVYEVTDDLCGEIYYVETNYTPFTFGWGGKQYEVDLCEKCERAVEKKPIGMLIAASRKVKAEKKPAPAKGGAPKTSRSDAGEGSKAALYEKRKAYFFNGDTEEYECPHEGCEFSRPTIGPVSTHYGRLHAKETGATLLELAQV